jgi:class 3 adenylate cyclase
MRIPRTVRDTILHRLERLDREDVAVLSAASVMGRSIDVKSLAAVAGVDEEAVLSALEASISAQLLEEEDRISGRYRFRHALTREAIYEDLVVPRRQQLHARVADVLASRPDRVAVDLANHLLMAGRYDEAVGMCVTAAEDAIRAVAYRDAAELLERAAPYAHDSVGRARMLLQAADCYWNNTESGNAKRLLEPAIADLEAAGLDLEAAGHRVLLGRCFWELLRSDLAKEQFERAREVLEPQGPSEALAVVYIRLSGMYQFNEELALGLEYATRAAEIAERAGADLAKSWSWNFMAGCEIGLGQVELGNRHMEDSYRSSLAGGYRFQVSNAVYNGFHCALRLGAGDTVATWFDRIGSAWPTDTDAWSPYLRSLAALERGRVVEAIGHARTAGQRSRDTGHQKMGWRSAVALAHALAENLAGDEAAAVLPPVSTRVEVQDAAYDGASRIRVRLAAGDSAGAFESAKTIPPNACHMAAPVDAMAEVAGPDPGWLRSFLDALPAKGQVLASPRVVAAKGRLALFEGRFVDAVDLLNKADSDFRHGGLLLDSWHLGRALAEAQFRAGDVEAAQRRLMAIVSEAEPLGGRLASKLARDTASRLGLEMPAAPEAAAVQGDADRVATGERMVSVMFADVRGYTQISGSNPPAEMTERIGTLQRWASQEVGRRRGRVDKFGGDSVMATFNISGESVDHTLQALQAAIAIIDKASLIDLPVGAGVAVGPAVVGRLTEAGNVSVLGEVTNLAARLQSQSAGGEVTLTAEAYRRVEGWLAERGTAVERVELQLKGFAVPVIAYRVRASTGAGIRA